jgi:hypothetical protein
VTKDGRRALAGSSVLNLRGCIALVNRFAEANGIAGSKAMVDS